jgi:hypothetical protein
MRIAWVHSLPIGDDELDARLETMVPWAADAAELSRLFGLRHGEAFWGSRRHIDRTLSNEIGALRFGLGETKSGNEEIAYGGEAGLELLLRLENQAIERSQTLPITWPGKKHFRAHLAGKDVPKDCWIGLKSVRTSWTQYAGGTKRSSQRRSVTCSR